MSPDGAREATKLLSGESGGAVEGQCHLLIFLGDFVADISATQGACNGCQGFTVACTHLIAQQSTDNCAHTNSNRTILSSRCRGRV